MSGRVSEGFIGEWGGEEQEREKGRDEEEEEEVGKKLRKEKAGCCWLEEINNVMCKRC